MRTWWPSRKAAGFTQEDVARSAGVSLKGVSDIERDVIADPHISSLIGIARALGVTIGQLLEPAPSRKRRGPSSTMGED